LSRRTTAAIGPAASVLDSVRHLVQALRLSSTSAQDRVGVSGAQLYVLRQLASASTPLSVNELAERTLTHQSSVSAVVQRLEAQNLVRRARSPHDARQMEISLAPAARALLRKAPEAAQERLVGALARMPARRRSQFASLLRDFVHTVSDAAQPAPMFFEETQPRKGKRKPRARS